ncbi:MAG: hypothetical protein NTW25_01865 [Candidatus Kapabacteria bacterium]|nr:hypothetical protein [Candidatus Kapabacteria bacterium]
MGFYTRLIKFSIYSLLFLTKLELFCYNNHDSSQIEEVGYYDYIKDIGEYKLKYKSIDTIFFNINNLSNSNLKIIQKANKTKKIKVPSKYHFFIKDKNILKDLFFYNFEFIIEISHNNLITSHYKINKKYLQKLNTNKSGIKDLDQYGILKDLKFIKFDLNSQLYVFQYYFNIPLTDLSELRYFGIDMNGKFKVLTKNEIK